MAVLGDGNILLRVAEKQLVCRLLDSPGLRENRQHQMVSKTFGPLILYRDSVCLYISLLNDIETWNLCDYVSVK
jgi:hypothetical protein